jgi:predicted nucleotidyltransferase
MFWLRPPPQRQYPLHAKRDSIVGMPDPQHTPELVNRTIVHWAKSCGDIHSVALVGSYARGDARADSDIDFVVLAETPEKFRADASWPESIDWKAIGMHIRSWQDENYGVVWSRRIYLEPHLEVEISFAPLFWASVNPLDPGTRRVVADGCRILHDPDGLLDRLCASVKLMPVSPSSAP